MNQHKAFAQEQLKPLTSLRFVAALLVFVYHCEPTAAIGAAYALGHAGVGFFFLLSGFILTYTYHSHFRGRLSWHNICAFYIARIARVYPLYLVAMVPALAVLWKYGGTYWDRSDAGTRELAFAAQSLMIQSWFPNEKVYFGLNAPAWSISVEAAFYALFPLLIGSLLRSFGRSSPRIILVAAALPWLILVTVVLAPHRIVVWTAYVVPPVRLVDFIVGMMVGIAFLRQREIAPTMPNATLLEAAAMAAVIGAVLLSPNVPESLRYALYLMPFWALLIWTLVWQQGAISRFLSRSPFVRLGEASFALYLTHWTVIQVVTKTVGWDAAVPTMLLAFGTTLCLSFALFQFIEQPLRIRIRRSLSRPVPPRGAAATEQVY